MKAVMIVIPIIIALIAITVATMINFDESTSEIDQRLKKIQQQNEILKDIETNYDAQREREWLTSGPFQIDRSEYALGENIFIRINEMDPTEKGQIAFLRPLNDTHKSVYITIPFDGSKPSFNQYFTPDLSKIKKICSIDDITGKWSAVFQGTNYDNIEFTVLDNVIVPGEEPRFEPVC
jgi:hypothetical protein